MWEMSTIFPGFFSAPSQGSFWNRFRRVKAMTGGWKAFYLSNLEK
jgi:hypothetical protein